MVSRLFMGTKSYLAVAVQNAAVLLPRLPGQNSRIQVILGKWSRGRDLPLEGRLRDDELLYLNRNTLWRVASDMLKSAHVRTGMNWSAIWHALTGEPIEDVEINAIKTMDQSTNVDFVELFNPGNFKLHKGNLVAGGTYDIKVDPSMDLTR